MSRESAASEPPEIDSNGKDEMLSFPCDKPVQFGYPDMPHKDHRSDEAMSDQNPPAEGGPRADEH